MAKNDFQYGGWHYYTPQCTLYSTVVYLHDMTA